MKKASDATPALRTLLAAERAAFDMLDPGDPLAPRFGRAIVELRFRLKVVGADPLRSGSMSPTATLVPATNRAAADARRLGASFCLVRRLAS